MRRILSFVLILFLLPLFAVVADQKADKKSAKRPDKKAAKADSQPPAFAEELPHGVKFGTRQKQLWKVGLIITAPAGPCGAIFATVPVPTDWPEQQVRVVDKEFSAQVPDVEYRMLDNGVKQMLVSIPQLDAGITAKALVTFEVTRCAILPPESPDQFVIAQRSSRSLAPFLAPSPYIESAHAKIKSLAKEIVKDRESPWQQVETIYDYVREHVEYKEGKLKGALAALKDGNGDCEELTSLFIALCRANKIPARTVWVHGHCYPEFYLEDSDGNGHWIPCQAAGTRDFGGMPDTRPILQKGDNFRVPEKKETQRYVAEFLSAKCQGGEPKVKFVRELLPAQ